MQAVILAGGRGTRLSSRLAGRPKPLIDVLGVPLLERQILALKAHGVDDFLVLVNHAADQIEHFLQDKKHFGARITLLDDGDPRGTAGAVLAARDALADRFVIIYGDTLFDIDLASMRAFHEARKADITLFLHPNDHPHDSDLVELDESGAVVLFHGYPHAADALHANLVNAAFYIVEKSALANWNAPSGIFDFAKHLFPQMLGTVRMFGYKSFEYIKDIGTPERLDKAEQHLADGIVVRARLSEQQKCVFIDRDGTLNQARGYVRRSEELELIPGAAKAVKRLNEREYRVALVTNQPVIARGEATEQDLRRIHAKLETVLGREGAFLDGLYFCPHHPDSGFEGERRDLKGPCECRKPLPGLLQRAADDLNASKEHSWMVGDSRADILAAKAFGVRSIFVASGEGKVVMVDDEVPDFAFPDIESAVDFIVDGYIALRNCCVSILETVQPGSIVLIGGPARSGKSTTASLIRHELHNRGLNATVLALDRWIRSQEDRQPGLLGRYDVDAALQILLPWLKGGALDAALPIYNRFARQRAQRTDQLHLGKDTVLVVEGVNALMIPIGTQRPIIRIYIEATQPDRHDRLMADLLYRGSSTEEARALISARDLDEVPHITNIRAAADVIINTSILTEIAV